MKQISVRDTLEFQRGREFEALFARDMIMRGHMVMRCYSMGEEKAPMLEGRFGGKRLPDLQIITTTGKPPFWAECKEKFDCTRTRSAGFREDEGIDLACYRDYCDVQRLSSMPVFLVIAEWRRKRILAQSIDRLGNPRIVSAEIATYGKGGMAYWPCANFVEWGEYDQRTGQMTLPFGPYRKTRAE